MRSQICPNKIPPIAQPIKSTEVKSPVQKIVADLAAAAPIVKPRRVGTALGAT
jgi:hypothetical protein